ncbi:hypothetical protein ABZX92_23635 [Lentzea sp. NPDC006480]|uniref:hypothetical protein n=1 Tax=Lentzea sp. NPDC006480 TaxID=3157176 RepID=UPI00339F3CED
MAYRDLRPAERSVAPARYAIVHARQNVLEVSVVVPVAAAKVIRVHVRRVGSRLCLISATTAVRRSLALLDVMRV